MKDLFEELFNDRQNLVINGDISSGKTKNLLMPMFEEMILRDESVFVTDSKEEYLTKYYDELIRRNYKVLIFNLRDFTKSECFNPLLYPYYLYKNNKKSKAIDLLEEITKVIFKKDKNSDQFWNESATNLFIGYTLFLFENAKEEEINIKSIKELVNKEDINKLITEEDKTFNTYLIPFKKCPKETYGSILSVVNTVLPKYTMMDDLNIFMSKNTFDFKEIVNNKSAIFFITPDENKKRNEISSFFIDQLYDVLLNEKRNISFNMVLDNFDTLKQINYLEEKLSSSISRDIKFVISTRSYRRITDIYGKYISRLIDYIKLQDGTVRIIHNDDQIQLDLPKLDIGQYVSKVNYPCYTNCEVSVFSFDDSKKDVSYDELLNKINERIEEVLSRDEEDDNNSDETDSDDIEEYNVNDLVMKIDKKIAELEKEQKEEEIRNFRRKENDDLNNKIIEKIEKQIKKNSEKQKYDALLRKVNERVDALYKEESKKEKLEEILKRIDSKLEEINNASDSNNNNNNENNDSSFENELINVKNNEN